MRKTFLAAAAVAIMCGVPASAKVGRVHTEEERRIAMLRMGECFATTATRFDDKVSPANVVAQAILPLCSAEINLMIDTMGPFRNERTLRKTREYLRDHSVLDTATSIVLRERANR